MITTNEQPAHFRICDVRMLDEVNSEFVPCLAKPFVSAGRKAGRPAVGVAGRTWRNGSTDIGRQL
jgi:hypothetical protein